MICLYNRDFVFLNKEKKTITIPLSPLESSFNYSLKNPGHSLFRNYANEARFAIDSIWNNEIANSQDVFIPQENRQVCEQKIRLQPNNWQQETCFNGQQSRSLNIIDKSFIRRDRLRRDDSGFDVESQMDVHILTRNEKLLKEKTVHTLFSYNPTA